MSASDLEWVIECRPTIGKEVANPFDEWLTWPVEKDQEYVNTEEGRADWIITRMEHYGDPTIRTPFMIGWTGLPSVDIRIRFTIRREK